MLIRLEIPSEKVELLKEVLQPIRHIGNVEDVLLFIDKVQQHPELSNGFESESLLVSYIIERISKFFDLNLLDKTRKKKIVFARHLSMTISHLITKQLSLIDIAKKHHLTTHATVLNSIKAIKWYYESDTKYGSMIVDCLGDLQIITIESFENKLEISRGQGNQSHKIIKYEKGIY